MTDPKSSYSTWGAYVFGTRLALAGTSALSGAPSRTHLAPHLRLGTVASIPEPGEKLRSLSEETTTGLLGLQGAKSSAAHLGREKKNGAPMLWSAVVLLSVLLSAASAAQVLARGADALVSARQREIV